VVWKPVALILRQAVAELAAVWAFGPAALVPVFQLAPALPLV
jgi:hypothetical protein